MSTDEIIVLAATVLMFALGFFCGWVFNDAWREKVAARKKGLMCQLNNDSKEGQR